MNDVRLRDNDGCEEYEDESVAPSPTELNWKQEGAGGFSANNADFSGSNDALPGRSAKALALDQGLPRLLYELAVRLPAQPDIQALCVWLYEPVRQAIRLHVLMADLPAGVRTGMDFPVEDSIASWVWQHQQPLTINTEAETRFPQFARALLETGVRSFCGLPLMIGNRRIGVLGLASTKPAAFRHFNLQCLQRSSPEAANVVSILPDLQSPADENRKRDAEPMYLEEQVRPEDRFDDIIGRSASLRGVLDQIQIVAPTDSTVLILGETGTGKELVARAILNRSSRRDKPFVRVNCAAIPSGLLESELFGHERGAFTGAIARKIGRFELANGGTLFLDEIGDIPPELQPKLLRVLQEQEFERLGSTVTTRVNVRVVAATSRDLPQMVANREFRSDLYYRLNVFPVRLPALRERTEDIALLVRHFVDLYAKRMKKKVDRVPKEAMKALLTYPWPGNVRELQNFIERAVILSTGKILRPPLAELKQFAADLGAFGQTTAPKSVTLKDAEREHIVQALAETNWVIGGPKGAAARLGLQRTTLVSKMQRLGISRAQA
jgi:formate hydrogenlyase transcriptional activator